MLSVRNCLKNEPNKNHYDNNRVTAVRNPAVMVTVSRNISINELSMQINFPAMVGKKPDSLQADPRSARISYGLTLAL